MSITLCAIMLNEERNLPTFLENIKGVFPYYVFVDGGSTDQSVKLVETAGYHVYHIPFELDFGKQKNRALNLAETKWRMFLDIDETMSRGTQTMLKCMDVDKLDGVAVSFFRDNYLDGISLDDFPLDFQIRLFDDTVFYNKPIHEKPDCSEKKVLKFFAGRIYHKKDSYKQYRSNLIYELICRGVREMPPPGEGAFNENGKLRRVKLLPDRQIQVLDEYIEGPLLNI